MCEQGSPADAGSVATGDSLFARLDSYESKGQARRKGKAGRWLVEKGTGLGGADVPRWVSETKGRAYQAKAVEDDRHVEMAEALEPSEESFWHSGWEGRRRRVAEALASVGCSAAVQSRFRNCGSRAWVWRHKGTGDVRVHADFCRNRFCVRCAARVGRRARKTLETLTEGKEIRLLTLTLRHVRSDELAVLKDRLLAAFKALRREPCFRRVVRGGAYVLETKFNERGEGWHPHLHVVAECGFIPVKQFREAWRKHVGEGNIDVQRVRSREGVARYVAKYVTKQFDGSVFHDPDRLAEALRAFAGSRLLGTFGGWRGVELVGEEEAFDKEEWKPLCRMTDLLREAGEGAAHAIRVLALLSREGESPGDV